MKMKNIFVVIDGEQRGPLTPDELRDLLERGQIQNDTPALLEGDQEWSTVAKFARLPEKSTSHEVVGSGVQPMASLPRDIKNLKTNSSATAGELRGFMRQMRGKSPAEMLGAIAQSTLVRSLMVSTVTIVALLLALTAAPYFLDDNTGPKSGAKKVMNEKPVEKEKETTTKPSDGPPPVPAVNPPEVLGVGGEKTGKPTEVNPFENNDDPLGNLKID